MSLQDFDIRKIIIAAAILLIIVLAFILSQPSDEVEKPSVQPENQTNQTPPATKDVYEQKLDAVTADCMADASYINKQDCVSSSLLSAAISNLDTKYCDQIESQLLKDSCTQQVIYEQVKENDDPSFCEKLGNASQECIVSYYTSKVQFENDPKYCDMMGENDAAYKCHDAFYGNEAYETGNCSMLESLRKKGLCLTRIAVQQNDFEICYEINDFETYGQCLEKFFANVTPMMTDDGIKIYIFENELE